MSYWIEYNAYCYKKLLKDVFVIDVPLKKFVF